jgi:hypothetical protein
MTLKIQKSIENDLVVFTLTGRIRAEQVPELLTLVRSEHSTHQVVFDLGQVKLVDRDAVLFLALSETLGVELKNCSAYIRKWIDQERKARRNGSYNSAESTE